MVRIPPNGIEMNSWIAKQVLDIGVFGIIFPHVSSVEEAWNAVGACRSAAFDRAEIRSAGDPRRRAGARRALLGLTRQEYYKRADVWPSRRTVKSSSSSNVKRLVPSTTCRGFPTSPRYRRRIDRRRRFESRVGIRATTITPWSPRR